MGWRDAATIGPTNIEPRAFAMAATTGALQDPGPAHRAIGRGAATHNLQRAGCISCFNAAPVPPLDAQASAVKTPKKVNSMKTSQIIVSASTALAIGFSSALFAETPADAAAKAAKEMAKDVDAGAAMTQGVADAVTDAAADVNAAKDAGLATSEEAEAASRMSEAANTEAAEMMEAKIIADEAAKEAATDAVLEDSKELIEGN